LYDHAKKLTGKSILPGDVQTDEGSAFRGTYKAELPGTQAKPLPQGAPQGPQAPVKQPRQQQKPKSQLPALKVTKSEMLTPCTICKRPQFDRGNFTGCLCLKDLAKNAKLERTPNGDV